MADASVFREYVRQLQAAVARGNATEHTHRPALKTLLESALDGIAATNEPKRVECGAPDYAISRKQGGLTVGYVEAKDIGVGLADIEQDSARANPATANGRQFKRYRKSLPNLLLTDYAEFRWYVDGQRRSVARLAEFDGNAVRQAHRGGMVLRNDGIAETDALLFDFLRHSPEPVASPEELARRMARLTHLARDVVAEGFRLGRLSADISDLYLASREVLVPDLSQDAFADMFAQTLAYGLFAARVNHPRENGDSGEFSRHIAAHHIPQANPFIRRIFALVSDPALDDEPFAGFVDDLAQLLGNADMEAVLSGFGAKASRQDPILHFYETFLAAYDPALRERRGVYYTPEPVVSYIVRSVDWLLRERFDCADGLADYSTVTYNTLEYTGGADKTVERQSHRVLVLDPACGTGSFLYAVIDHIREHYRSADNAGMWDGYVREHLLPRLFGFELLMAPYAMAHLKLGMQLAGQDLPAASRPDWAYDFASSERLGVYLTNSLEEGEMQVPMSGPYRIITDEANSAVEIKRDMPIMVVMGNPPYSGHSANASRKDGKLTWIGGLIEDYKQVDGKGLGERNTKWLQDDYVKFIRFGQHRIHKTGAGILAFVTNHGYLDNPTFRGMRQQLMDTFTDIFLLDLHGNSRMGERAPDGGVDENVFDIQQGVAIAIFVKEPDKSGPAVLRHSGLYGAREAKYEILSESDISTTGWTVLAQESPDYRFKPWDGDAGQEYLQWPKITEIMPVNSVGIVTARDSLTIHWSKDDVMPTVQDFANLPPETARSRYNLGNDAQDWKVNFAQRDLTDSGLDEALVQPVLYRPFDTRYTYYTGNSRGFICRPRNEVMRNMLGGNNLGLIATRQTRDPWDALATDSIIAHKAMAAYDLNSLFPLYVHPSEQSIEQGLYQRGERQPNLDQRFTAAMERRLGLRFIADGQGDLQETFGPEGVLRYIYAVFHSPTYRERYGQFLRADFPRVPLVDDPELFRTLVGLGGRLTRAHLLESSLTSQSAVSFPVAGDNVIEKGYPKYYGPGETPPGENASAERGRVYISANAKKGNKRGQYFEGIEPEIWEFRIGGYQPMDKWLKDRRGRALSYDDLSHYRRAAAALQETIGLMEEVDRAINDSANPWQWAGAEVAV